MTKRITTLSMLTAMSLVIFIIEAQIPPPIPIAGVKLGLANVITLICVRLFKKKETFAVLGIRIILSSIFCGTFMSFIYSAAGGLSAACIIIFTQRIFKNKLLWVSSIFGALAHNAAQIITAALLLNDIKILYYIPVLVLSGIITGLFTGLAAEAAVSRLKIWSKHNENN